MSVFIRKFLVILINLYQFLLSPWLGSNCRFYPTCSHYAKDVIFLEKNLLKAIWLIFYRIIKCNPLNSGGYDPAPQTNLLCSYNFNMTQADKSDE